MFRKRNNDGKIRFWLSYVGNFRKKISKNFDSCDLPLQTAFPKNALSSLTLRNSKLGSEIIEYFGRGEEEVAEFKATLEEKND